MRIGLERASIYLSFTIQDGNTTTYTIGYDSNGNNRFALTIGDEIVTDQFGRGYVLYKRSTNSFPFGDYANSVLR